MIFVAIFNNSNKADWQHYILNYFYNRQYFKLNIVCISTSCSSHCVIATASLPAVSMLLHQLRCLFPPNERSDSFPDFSKRMEKEYPETSQNTH